MIAAEGVPILVAAEPFRFVEVVFRTATPVAVGELSVFGDCGFVGEVVLLADRTPISFDGSNPSSKT